MGVEPGSKVPVAQGGTLSKERGLMPPCLLRPSTSQAYLGTTWLLRERVMVHFILTVLRLRLTKELERTK